MRVNPSHPALTFARTIHRTKVIDPKQYKGNILKSVSDNTKLGNGENIIVKGDWRGMPMFSLTLEERNTCPKDCIHWDDCYGNGMMFAYRFKHGRNLERKIQSELDMLSKKYVYGFVVRLHILGDFYSASYVNFWKQMMKSYPMLRVFGYTARWKKDPIGKALDSIRLEFPERWWIRVSRNNSNLLLSAYSVHSPISVHCPKQTGKTESCLTCGLCWKMQKPVYFQSHDELAKKRKEIKSCSL